MKKLLSFALVGAFVIAGAIGCGDEKTKSTSEKKTTEKKVDGKTVEKKVEEKKEEKK